MSEITMGDMTVFDATETGVHVNCPGDAELHVIAMLVRGESPMVGLSVFTADQESASFDISPAEAVALIRGLQVAVARCVAG